MKKITIVVGARPNFIKVAPLIRAIEKTPEASYHLVYAGREDDPTLEATLFDDLQIPRPDSYMGVDSTSLNEITSRVMAEFDSLLDRVSTDVVIVVDDLASTMAAAITAKKRGLLLAHLVAGTRSFDMKMPKEVNRLVIDALSDYLFTAGVKSNSVATREQAEGSNTYMVGNILMDSLRYNHQRFHAPAGFTLKENNYIVFTINRKALLDDEQKMNQLLDAMVNSVHNMPIIAPLRGKAADVVAKYVEEHPNTSLQLVPPMSYLEFGWLTAHALGVITDSGNVAEEATFNNVACITLNSYTEHMETVIMGTNILVGEDPERLAYEASFMADGEWKLAKLPDRWDGRTADRIVQILLS